MRHFSRSHGRHCYLRSFHTKCPKCKADVLYWECRHGCKVFFEYPPYGKLQRHYCRKRELTYSKKNHFPVIVKIPKGILVDASISCPVCGKLFNEDSALKDHLIKMKINDSEHELFIENKLVFEDEVDEVTKKRKRDYPRFGKINLKK